MKCGILYFYESPSYLFAYLIANSQLLSISTGCQSYNTCPVGNATIACKRKGGDCPVITRVGSLGPCVTSGTAALVSALGGPSQTRAFVGGEATDSGMSATFPTPFEYFAVYITIFR